MKNLILCAAAISISAPLHAQSDLERGLSGALRGCEEWVLNPSSWADGGKPFLDVAGLGNMMGRVDSVAEVNLPPEEMRRANHYWRINATPTAGYVLVVSDQIPICYITGGGDADLQPVVEAVLASPEFSQRWELVEDRSRDDMISTKFRNRGDQNFSIIISRAKLPRGRQDRVQVIATAELFLVN